MKRAQWIILCGTIVLFSCTVFAQASTDAFDRGNELYRAGKYQEAVKEYESIINQGKFSAELYFNLGNAFYRDRQLARAILSYKRAAQYHPNDPDIEHNLKLAYLKTIDRIEPVPEMFFIQWMHATGSLMPAETVRVIFILSWIFLFCSLTTMYWLCTRVFFVLFAGCSSFHVRSLHSLRQCSVFNRFVIQHRIKPSLSRKRLRQNHLRMQKPSMLLSFTKD